MLDDNNKLTGGETEDEQDSLELIGEIYSNNFNPSILCEPARRFFEISIDAFSAFVQAWMSELPIQTQILNFGRRVITAGENAAFDRGDEDVRTVHAAAYKVQREYHRMMGFLRFTPDDTGIFLARCAPDHLVLPALGDYFTARFGETAGWAVIDEKRGLCLSRRPGEQAKIEFFSENKTCYSTENSGKDEWEELWQHYHNTINNEDRKNPKLQRQLMPKRYWKYLPEM